MILGNKLPTDRNAKKKTYHRVLSRNGRELNLCLQVQWHKGGSSITLAIIVRRLTDQFTLTFQPTDTAATRQIDTPK